MSDKPTCKTCKHYQLSGLCGGIKKQFEAGLGIATKIVVKPDSTCKVHTPKEER